MYTTPNCNTVITTKQHIKIFLDQQPAFITTITMAVGKMQNCGMCKVKCGMKTVKMCCGTVGKVRNAEICRMWAIIYPREGTVNSYDYEWACVVR